MFLIPVNKLLYIHIGSIMPVLLKFWNPWENKHIKDGDKKEECKFSCDCAWLKKDKSGAVSEKIEESVKTNSPIENKVKGL
ncbi:hypothetical protein GWI33_008170 [Rhynchophorus ferrugineus]|uniref:Uncharacterized protein n=1 Tax=Rhynchophorus ferrugineus TaxID=354439 RepID=A0A834ICA4_RHYFE|nr:hypothetical protein GWI33_008170 [Rhynchophorus ferrugineus]